MSANLVHFEPCPVHDPNAIEYEKTALVCEMTNHFHCFTCGARGNYREAVKKAFWQAHDEATKELTPLQKRFAKQSPESIGKFEPLANCENGKRIAVAELYEDKTDAQAKRPRQSSTHENQEPARR